MNDTVFQETASIVRFCLRSWPHTWLKLCLISLTSNPRSNMVLADSFNSDRRPVWVSSSTSSPSNLLTPSLSQSSLVWINIRDMTSRENIFVILLTLCLLWCLSGPFTAFFVGDGHSRLVFLVESFKMEFVPEALLYRKDASFRHIPVPILGWLTPSNCSMFLKLFSERSVIKCIYVLRTSRRYS